MEQQRYQLDVAASKRRDLAQARALELQAQHPQLSVFENGVEDRSPEALHGSGGGDAGLARVVGKGRKPKAVKGASNGKMNDADSCSSSDSNNEMRGGAHTQGKMLGEHLMKLHGAGFFDDFLSGLKSVAKPLANVAAFLPGPLGMVGKVASVLGGKKPRGRPRKDASFQMSGGNNQIVHATYDSPPGSAIGGQDVPPGGVAPRVYGNVPQAPASFERNTVGMGKLTITHGGRAKKAQSTEQGAGFISDLGIPLISNVAGMFGLGKEKKPKRPPTAYQTAMGKLMREKKMKMAEAAAYLKKHGY